ncbi:ankyrin repeat-containing domain protein [Xylaria curta]|nr:ankyrin repeat-containing domain protein [Xylaria curta]
MDFQMPGVQPSELERLALNNDTEAVQALLYDTHQQEEDIEAALTVAIKQHRTEMVKIIITAVAPSYQPTDWFNPLRIAVKERNVSIFQTMILAGATLNSTSRRSILYSAIINNELDLVEYLIKPIPDDRVSFLNTLEKLSNGYIVSALWVAVNSGKIDIVRCLVQEGADLSLQCTIDDCKQLAIHAAFRLADVSSKSGLEIMKYLISVKSDQLEAKTSRDETCLHLAAKLDDSESVEWLLSQCDYYAAKTKNDETPWQLARERGGVKVMRAFLKKEWESYLDRTKVRGESSYHNTTIWSESGRLYRYSFDFCWGGGKLVPEILDAVHKAEELRHFGLTDASYLAILDKIHNSSVEHSESDSAIQVRPGACTFETVEGIELTSVSMPYLSSTSIRFLTDRWKGSLKDPNMAKYCVPHDPKDFGADLEVTLDEYCNPALDAAVLEERNKDQVLTRYGQRLQPRTPHSDNEPNKKLRLITVPQVLCWKIGSKLALCGPKSTFHRILHERGYLGKDDNETIGRTLSLIVDFLDRPNRPEGAESIFSIFSKSISIVAEKVNKYASSTAYGKISVDEERRFLHDINDIREEISMMQNVVFQQEEIWKEFTYHAWPQFWPDGEDGRFKPVFDYANDKSNHDNARQLVVWRLIAKPQSQFAKYRKQFQRLDQDAERVERHILVQLDLKQKHAALKEAHTATVISSAVVGFTVITIIFTPLSFLASLFALPIDQFQQNKDNKYTSSYIGKWIAIGESVSFVVTGLAIWGASVYFLRRNTAKETNTQKTANAEASLAKRNSLRSFWKRHKVQLPDEEKN